MLQQPLLPSSQTLALLGCAALPAHVMSRGCEVKTSMACSQLPVQPCECSLELLQWLEPQTYCQGFRCRLAGVAAEGLDASLVLPAMTVQDEKLDQYLSVLLLYQLWRCVVQQVWSGYNTTSACTAHSRLHRISLHTLASCGATEA